MDKCTYIELFAGVGGLHIGLDRGGDGFFKCAMAFPDYLDRPARTLITSEVSSNPNRFTHVIRDPENGRLRRLISIELERIQMFPDNHTEGTTDKKRGFLMGNALVCGIVERIGRELKNRICR